MASRCVGLSRYFQTAYALSPRVESHAFAICSGRERESEREGVVFWFDWHARARVRVCSAPDPSRFLSSTCCSREGDGLVSIDG
eukprot:1965648-Lingulodinium_polyedra.AAC.1